jgi:hypothetical protein
MLVDETRRRIGLDGFSWLNGTGLALQVVGQKLEGLVLPARWTLH